MEPSLVSPAPLRPDPRRAFAESGASTMRGGSGQPLYQSQPSSSSSSSSMREGEASARSSSTADVRYLHQAANYAALVNGKQRAAHEKDAHSTTGAAATSSHAFEHSLDTFTSSASRLVPPHAYAKDLLHAPAHPESSQRRLHRHGNADKYPSGYPSAASNPLDADGDGVRNAVAARDEDNDELCGWDTAPRLSMSSAESSGGSEVKTPESINAHLSWRTTGAADEQANIVDEKVIGARQHSGSHSPGLVDMTDAVLHPNGLTAAGFETAERVARSSTNSELVEAARRMDGDDEDGAIARPSSSQSSLAQRSATIKAKRPDGLLKLPSTSFDTDRTVTPSTSDVVGIRTPSNGPEARREKHLLREWHHQTDESRLEAEQSDSVRFPTLASADEGLAREDTRETFINRSDQTSPQPQSPISRTATSPDSWRSLLPEHDPYFIPPAEQQESSTSSSRVGSDARDSINSANQALKTLRLDGSSVDASRRWSNESQRSSFSLPGPVAMSPNGSYSASSSLYDLDGTFNSSGSRAAFAPLQYDYNQSSKSLASPSLSSAGFGEVKRVSVNGRMSESLMDQQRRHASFSTFDGRNAQNRSAFRHAPFVHPDYLAGSKTSPSLASSQARRLPTGSSRSDVIPWSSGGTDRKELHTPSSDDGRENWPSSRNSIQCASPAHSFVLASPRTATVLGPTYTQQGAADGKTSHESTTPANGSAYDTATVAALPVDVGQFAPMATSPPSVVSTSTLESTSANEEGAITTTRTTTTTTTTTTVFQHPSVSPPPAVQSGAFSVDHSTTPIDYPTAARSMHSSNLARTASLQAYPCERQAPYEVSPLSPPSLPFLDSRPAPSSTDFSIDTQPTHYTLKTKLPGFTLEGITLATKHHCQLVIVADKWDENNGGHFERRITFGPDVDLKATRARFDGTLLKITVPRRQ